MAGKTGYGLWKCGGKERTVLADVEEWFIKKRKVPPQ